MVSTAIVSIAMGHHPAQTVSLSVVRARCGAGYHVVHCVAHAVVHACAKPASATPATVTAKSGVLVRRRKGASCSVGSASGAAEKPKMTRKTPSCSVSPPMTRDLGELRC